MNQDDIYNLLLLLLLMSNERENDENDCRSTRGSLNELILASMLLNSCNSRDTDSRSVTRDACGRIRNNDTNTTF